MPVARSRGRIQGVDARRRSRGRLPRCDDLPRARRAGQDCCPRPRNGVRMEIQTSRFGRMNVDDDRIMTFPTGCSGSRASTVTH